MDEPPRDPPPQPEPTEPAAPVTPAPEPAPEPGDPPGPRQHPHRVRTHRRVDPARRQQAEPDRHPGPGRHRCGRARGPRVHHLHRLAGRPTTRPLRTTSDVAWSTCPSSRHATATSTRATRPSSSASSWGRPPSRASTTDLLRYWQLSEIVLQHADDSDLRAGHAPDDHRPTRRGDLVEDPRRSTSSSEMLEITFTAFEAELKDTPGPPPPSTPTCRRPPSPWRTRWASMR